MKLHDLERHLTTSGCQILREGANHIRWGRLDGPQRTSVPRHREIKPGLVRAICKDLDISPPSNVS